MSHANRPSGPGKPIQERRDATTEREELDETLDEAQGTAAEGDTDPTRSARQAERNAHVKGKDANTTTGTSRDRRG
jgi:hypothetical protein